MIYYKWDCKMLFIREHEEEVIKFYPMHLRYAYDIRKPLFPLIK
jgi:hypothetical protein